MSRQAWERLGGLANFAVGIAAFAVNFKIGIVALAGIGTVLLWTIAVGIMLAVRGVPAAAIE
jgi:hypothetical protein